MASVGVLSGLDLLASVSSAGAALPISERHLDSTRGDKDADIVPAHGGAAELPSFKAASPGDAPPAHPLPGHGTSTPDRDAATSAPAGRRPKRPLPFVRKMRLHMDSCAGTNKSQYFYGGLGLMLSCGLLDCGLVLYMVVGHTKFGPDRVAQALAGRFNRSDAFNHGQLVQMFKEYATSGAYDGSMLQTWRDGTKKVFSPITHIMSYRCILLLADNGNVNLGDPVEELPTGFEPFEDTGRLVSDAVLMGECKKAAARGLRDVFSALNQGTYMGVGQEALPDRNGAPPETMLLPDSVSSCRLVRLFTRRSADDPFWREQPNWMMTTELSKINEALAAIQPYSEHPELRKIPYGAKAKALGDMYAKYVPRRFVPDRFEVASAGASGMASVLWKQTALVVEKTEQSTKPGASTAASVAEDQGVPRDELVEHAGGGGGGDTPVESKARWYRALHTKPLMDLLLAPPYNGRLPQSPKDWLALTAGMPTSGGSEWDVRTIKRHAKIMAAKAPNLCQ